MSFFKKRSSGFGSRSSLTGFHSLDYWQQLVVHFLNEPEGPEYIHQLGVPIRQFGFDTFPQFVASIPDDMVQNIILQEPERGFKRNDTIFWIHDMQLLPGQFLMFIETNRESKAVAGIILDQKLPKSLRDPRVDKYLKSPKKGHAAIVCVDEIVPHRKYLRSHLRQLQSPKTKHDAEMRRNISTFSTPPQDRRKIDIVLPCNDFHEQHAIKRNMRDKTMWPTQTAQRSVSAQNIPEVIVRYSASDIPRPRRPSWTAMVQEAEMELTTEKIQQIVNRKSNIGPLWPVIITKTDYEVCNESAPIVDTIVQNRSEPHRKDAVRTMSTCPGIISIQHPEFPQILIDVKVKGPLLDTQSADSFGVTTEEESTSRMSEASDADSEDSESETSESDSAYKRFQNEDNLESDGEYFDNSHLCNTTVIERQMEPLRTIMQNEFIEGFKPMEFGQYRPPPVKPIIVERKRLPSEMNSPQRVVLPNCVETVESRNHSEGKPNGIPRLSSRLSLNLERQNSQTQTDEIIRASRIPSASLEDSQDDDFGTFSSLVPEQETYNKAKPISVVAPVAQPRRAATKTSIPSSSSSLASPHLHFEFDYANTSCRREHKSPVFSSELSDSPFEHSENVDITEPLLKTIISSLFMNTIRFHNLLLPQHDDAPSVTYIKTILREKFVPKLSTNQMFSSADYHLLNAGLIQFSLKKYLPPPDSSTMSFTSMDILNNLFGKAWNLGPFLHYNSHDKDYVHKIVYNRRDRTKCETVQYILEKSMELRNLKFVRVPSPAMIIQLPDKKLYDAVIPNMLLNVTRLMDNDATKTRLCLCGMAPTYQCQICERQDNGYGAAIVYCNFCKENAEYFHSKMGNHKATLMKTMFRDVTLSLVGVICYENNVYKVFLNDNQNPFGNWSYVETSAIDTACVPKRGQVTDIGKLIYTVGKDPGTYNVYSKRYPLLATMIKSPQLFIYASP